MAELKRIGFDGYLVKPVRQKQLHDCIALLLGRIERPSGDLSREVVTRHTIAERTDKNVRVLLVEDNMINQKVALRFLNNLGYKTDAVVNGREAVSALERINYDLVLMDCMMPEMDGYEATAMIRNPLSGVSNHSVPIIALTANAISGDREVCIQAGMNDYLAKPLKKAALAEVMERWLPHGGTTLLKKAELTEVTVT